MYTMVQRLVFICMLVYFVAGATWQGKIPSKPKEFAALQRPDPATRKSRGSLSAYFALKNIIEGRQNRTPSNNSYRPTVDVENTQHRKWKFVDIEQTTLDGEVLDLSDTEESDTDNGLKNLDYTSVDHSVKQSSDDYRPTVTVLKNKRKEKRKRKKNMGETDQIRTEEVTSIRTNAERRIPGFKFYNANSVPNQVYIKSNNYRPVVTIQQDQTKEKKPQISEDAWSKKDVLLSSGKLNIEDVIQYVKNPIRPHNKNKKRTERKKKLVRTIDEPNRVKKRFKNNRGYTDDIFNNAIFDSLKKLKNEQEDVSERGNPRQRKGNNQFLIKKSDNYVVTDEARVKQLRKEDLHKFIDKYTHDVYQSITKKVPPNDDKTKKPQNLSGCYVEEIAGVIPYGAQISPIGYCYSIECSKHRLYYSSCSKVDTDDPKCFITDVDTTKAYPQCCPQVKCVNENNI